MTDFAHKTLACDYRTPRVLWEALHKVFNFEVDLMASDDNHLFPEYFTATRSILTAILKRRRCFVNPAWGKGFRPTLNELVRLFRTLASEHENLVVALLPARDDVVWMHEDVLGWASILKVRGRPIFDKPGGSGPCTVIDAKGVERISPAKFPINIVVWEPGCVRRAYSETRSWDPYGRGAAEDEEDNG